MTITEVGDAALELMRSGEVIDFLQHFSIDPDRRAALIVEALHELNPRKGGLVRFQLEQDSTRWDKNIVEAVMSAARKMGMLDIETPLTGKWEMLVVPGGARMANYDRLEAAARAVASGLIKSGKIVIIGSERELNEAERKFVASFAPQASTEYDLCESALASVSKQYPGIVYQLIRKYGASAGTPEVITAVLKAYEARVEVESFAVFTHQIYRCFTLFEAARANYSPHLDFAGFHNLVDVAGIPSEPKIIEARTTATYLSEVIRTIIAALKLRELLWAIA